MSEDWKIEVNCPSCNEWKALAERQRDKYHEAMDILSQWKNIDCAAAVAENRDLKSKLAVARDALSSDHVQNNKHRLGVLGAQDIESALAAIDAPPSTK